MKYVKFTSVLSNEHLTFGVFFFFFYDCKHVATMRRATQGASNTPLLLTGNAQIGVSIFFVISGYLITQSIENRPGAPRQRILAFYGRRIRRVLLPLYIYLLLVAPYIFLRYPVLIEGWLASFSFTYNIYHLLSKMVHSRLLTLIWSLGVEEQFYLVFPFLMVLWRRRATALLIAVVLSAPVIR